MKNKIDDLRNHLFETLEALKDKENPMEIDRAKAIAQVAGVIVESAKVECQFVELTGAKGSGFIPTEQIEGPGKTATPRLVGKQGS